MHGHACTSRPMPESPVSSLLPRPVRHAAEVRGHVAQSRALAAACAEGRTIIAPQAELWVPQGKGLRDDLVAEESLHHSGGHNLVAAAVRVAEVLRLEHLWPTGEGVVDKDCVWLGRREHPFHLGVDGADARLVARVHKHACSSGVPSHDQDLRVGIAGMDGPDETPEALRRDVRRGDGVNVLAPKALVLRKVLPRVVDPVRQQHHLARLRLLRHLRGPHERLGRLAGVVTRPGVRAADVVSGNPAEAVLPAVVFGLVREAPARPADSSDPRRCQVGIQVCIVTDRHVLGLLHGCHLQLPLLPMITCNTVPQAVQHGMQLVWPRLPDHIA
mmetsp:Transcript_13116/g.40952  ORF Transcript_13116/g.40952 Transcript_13116/m.40952 type:complete len:330 (+) Transcript_13116:7-996(+)